MERRRTTPSLERAPDFSPSVTLDFTGFLCFFDLAPAPLCADTGLMLSGLPTGAPVVSLGSESGRKNTRQPGESWALLWIMQTVTRSTSGISAPQSRNASSLQPVLLGGVGVAQTRQRRRRKHGREPEDRPANLSIAQ